MYVETIDVDVREGTNPQSIRDGLSELVVKSFLPLILKCGVAESKTKFKNWCSSVESIGPSRTVSHAHICKIYFIDVVSWVLWAEDDKSMMKLTHSY